MTPVPVITGVVTTECAGLGGSRAEFDWYQASFPEVDEDEFLGRFLSDHDLTSVEQYRGKTHGYEHGYVVKRGDEALAGVLCGGNGGAPLNAWATGSRARGFSTWARRRFSEHYVTRADGAIDFNRRGAWLDLQDLFFDIRHEFPRMQTSVVGDLFGQQKGVTLYVGSTKSESRIRMYQKGLQQPEAGQPDHVRAEIMVRPKGLLRYSFAKAPADMLWSYSPCSRFAFEKLRGFHPGDAVRETPRRSDLEKRLASLVRQYGPTIEEIVTLLGSSDAVLEALRSGTLPSAKPLR